MLASDWSIFLMLASNWSGYRAVVVVPTKELAVQIVNECSTLCAKNGLRAHMLAKVKQDKKVFLHCAVLFDQKMNFLYVLYKIFFIIRHMITNTAE